MQLAKSAHPDLHDSEIGWGTFMAMLDNKQKQTFLSQSNGQLDQYARTLKKEFLAAQTGHKSYRHPWLFYPDRSRRSLQMYNLWHEDRTAAGNHIENRVPFMGLFATHPPIEKRIQSLSDNSGFPIPNLPQLKPFHAVRAERAETLSPPKNPRENWTTRQRFKSRRTNNPWH